jgi:hypothetical protein
LAATASDAFTGTGALSADWTVHTGALARSSDQLAGSFEDYNRMYWNSTVFAADQYSRIVAGSDDAISYQVVSVRASGTGGTRAEYFYTFSQTANNADVFRVVAGTPTKIVNTAETFGLASPGDVVEMKVEGTGTSTLITVSINASPIFTYADNGGAALNSGAPGCGTFRTGSRIASWEGGDFAVGGGSTSGRATLLGVGN